MTLTKKRNKKTLSNFSKKLPSNSNERTTSPTIYLPQTSNSPDVVEKMKASDDQKLFIPKELLNSGSDRSSPQRSPGSASIDMNPPSVTTPLIPKPGTRPRKNMMPRYIPDEWDDSLPYGGKVYLARKKKPDSWLCLFIQVALVLFSFSLIYYAWYYTEHMHFHTARFYAHLGHVDAQAITAEKYLHGKGVEADHGEAFNWYKKAASNGHPHASYNLAVGHLQGHDVGLEPGEARKLIQHAADNGVAEALNALNLCSKTGQCDV